MSVCATLGSITMIVTLSSLQIHCQCGFNHCGNHTELIMSVCATLGSITMIVTLYCAVQMKLYLQFQLFIT